MLCDSNSASLMSIENSSSSEPIKKFSPVKISHNSWWEEVEAAQQIDFQDKDADIKFTPEKDKQTDSGNKSVSTMDPDMLTFANKINVADQNNKAEEVDEDDKECQFLDRTLESNDSNASNSREITLEFLDSSNENKYDRLVREVKMKTPFKRRFSGDSRSNSPISFFPMENEEKKIEPTSNKSEDNRAESVASSSSTSATSGRGHGKRRRFNQPLETSAEILARRQKQIDYGKNTIGYDNYIKQIPRNKRTKDHPWTPPKQFKYSRRAFDGLVKIWRTKLHCFDPPSMTDTSDNLNDDDNADDCFSGGDTSSDNEIGNDEK